MKKILLALILNSMALSTMAFNPELHYMKGSKTKEQYNCDGMFGEINSRHAIVMSKISGALLTFNTNEKEYLVELIDKMGFTEAKQKERQLTGAIDFQIYNQFYFAGVIYKKTFSELKKSGEVIFVNAASGSDQALDYMDDFYSNGIPYIGFIINQSKGDLELQIVGYDEDDNGYDLGKFFCKKILKK